MAHVTFKLILLEALRDFNAHIRPFRILDNKIALSILRIGNEHGGRFPSSLISQSNLVPPVKSAETILALSIAQAVDGGAQLVFDKALQRFICRASANSRRSTARSPSNDFFQGPFPID